MKNPKEIPIQELHLRPSIEKRLSLHGMKTAWDIAEYHNRYNLSSIAGINDRFVLYIGNELKNTTEMILPDVAELDHEWRWPNIYRILNIFIAQPMSGRTDDAVLYERQQAMKKIYDYFSNKKNVVLHFLDQFYVEGAPKNANRLWYLGHSIQILSKANYIYFTEDWKQASGCLIEAEIASRYHITNLNALMNEET